LTCTERAWMSVPKSIGAGLRRQKQPFFRQHFLKRLLEPQGQRSLRPSFSSSSLSPWTACTPRFTCVSDGYPRRRLLMLSKKMAVRQNVPDSCVARRTFPSGFDPRRTPVLAEGSPWHGTVFRYSGKVPVVG